MKKRLLAALLALGLMHGAACAKEAEVTEESRQTVYDLLNASYGYTQEEAQAFEISQWNLDEAVKLIYFPSDHPDWRYTVKIGPGEEWAETSPFDLLDERERYPGEHVLREGMRLAVQQWLPGWEQGGQAAMSAWMWQKDIVATARQQEGFATGSLPAGNALHELLVSCCGETFHWPLALLEWEKEALSGLGLSLTDSRTRGTVRFPMQTFFRAKAEVLRFEGEIPEELRQALSAPELAGWTPLCGCLLSTGGLQTGLAALERDGRRLLVMFRRSGQDAPWRLFSLGETGLYADRDFYITAGSNGRMFEIVYPLSATEREVFALYCQEDIDLCRVDGYLRINDLGCDGAEVAYDKDNGYTVIMTYADGRHQYRKVEKAANPYLPGFDANAFPKTLSDCWQAPESLLPEGYGVTHEVHLRAGRSTRSKDLGMYFAGTVVRILGEEPGSPSNWYHVRVGSVEGYMSCDYVDDLRENPCAATRAVLPVGEAVRETVLKEGTGWFAASKATLPAHTRFHVMAERGDWLHVMIPQGEMGWMMDPTGLDGYIRAEDVRYVSLTEME